MSAARDWQRDLWYAAPGREHDELVREAREEGYSDEQIADQAGVPTDTVRRVMPR